MPKCLYTPVSASLFKLMRINTKSARFSALFFNFNLILQLKRKLYHRSLDEVNFLNVNMFVCVCRMVRTLIL